MEIEEEALQLIVAELCCRQEPYPLPGERAIMQLIVSQRKAEVR